MTGDTLPRRGNTPAGSADTRRLVHRRKPRSQMSINLGPLALGREVSEKGCGCFPGAERLRFLTTPSPLHPHHHHLPSDPEAAERREDVGSSHLSPESKNATERARFCGCFIAGRLSHKCHTNLDRSHLMSEEAAAVRNRRLFAHCCRRVSPRVWSLHSAGPVARRSPGFLGESTPPPNPPTPNRKHDPKSARRSKRRKLKSLLAGIVFPCRGAKSILNKSTLLRSGENVSK